MNSGRAPERVCCGHFSDKGDDLGVDGRAAHRGPPGELGPVLAETAPLPPQDGVGSHDDEGRPPPHPHPGQRDPEEPIASPELGPGRRPLVNGELMAQGEVLEDKRPMAITEEREEADKVEQRADYETAIVWAGGSTVWSPGRDCTTMIYTHVLNRGPAGVRSPADRVLDP